MKASPGALAAKEAHYEFGGPIGAGLITASLPIVVLGLCFICGKDYCIQGFQFDTILGAAIHLPCSLGDLFSPAAFTICIQWFLFQVLLDRILPGKTVEGVTLEDGSRLPYKMSGHAAFWTSLIAVGLGSMEFGGFSYTRLNLSTLYDLYAELAVAAATMSLALSVGLYVASHRKGAKLADAAGTVGRSVMYDFFIGRELNPRIGPLDLKFFCELRPGLIGWVVINLGMMSKQREVLGYVSAPMIMVNVFQGLYVWDGLFFERAILTTMDITTEGFGYMLVFGDLCWVPLTYSLQAHYLVTNDPGLPLWAVGAISCLCLVGYTIFRRTNTPLTTDGRAAAAPSAFAGMAGIPPKWGSVFSSVAATNEPASASTGFSFGASTSGGTAGEPTPAAVFAPKPAAAVFAPTPAAAVFPPAPAASVLAQAPAAVSSPASSLLSVQDNAPAAAPIVFPKPLETALLPARPAASVQPAAAAPKADVVDKPAYSLASTGIIDSGGSGLAFGEGRTAAQGVRLNKLFVRWIAHQLSTNSASTLDTGLRDYVAFAAEIRDRVEIVGEDSGPATSASSTHPPASTATSSEAVLSASPSAPPTAAAAIPVRLAPAPTPIAAPAPVPARVATATPAFTFSSPSNLPAAPSGPQFSFGLQTSAASTKATGAPAVIAPSATSPAPTGFKLNGVGFGGFGAAHGGVFNGFQAPAAVAFAPAVPATTAGGAATEAEDDGMPKEDPSKLERAPGEEDEEIVCHFRAKLFRFKLEEKSWGDMGTGLLRLMKHTTNSGRRLVLRNDMGKVLLNAGFYEGMKVTKMKNAVKFIANIAGDGPTSVMIKVTPNDIQELHTSMLALVPP